MAWFDLPAASIHSTSSSRLVSCSTRPGTAAGAVPDRRPGLVCPTSKARWSRATQPSGTPAAARNPDPDRWAAISRASSAAIGGPSSAKTRT